MSPSRVDKTGTALKAWCRLGFPMITAALVVLIVAIVVMLLANETYTESQNAYWVRKGRFGAHSKIALLFAFTPIVIGYIISAGISWYRSFKSIKEPKNE